MRLKMKSSPRLTCPSNRGKWFAGEEPRKPQVNKLFLLLIHYLWITGQGGGGGGGEYVGAAELCVQYCLWCPLCIIHDCLTYCISTYTAHWVPLLSVRLVSPGGIQLSSPHWVYWSVRDGPWTDWTTDVHQKSTLTLTLNVSIYFIFYAYAVHIFAGRRSRYWCNVRAGEWDFFHIL